MYVLCVPSTPSDVLQRLALSTLKSRLPEKKTGIFALGDALEKISDYEYSQGYGARWDLEQALLSRLKEIELDELQSE